MAAVADYHDFMLVHSFQSVCCHLLPLRPPKHLSGYFLPNADAQPAWHIIQALPTPSCIAFLFKTTVLLNSNQYSLDCQLSASDASLAFSEEMMPVGAI